MRSIENTAPRAWPLVALAAAMWLSGCAGFRSDEAQPARQATTPTRPVAVARPSAEASTKRPAAAEQTSVSSWQAYRLRAAQRITQANAQASFSGPVPEPLASIPVLQVQLNADGSVRAIEVLRVPKFEPQTVAMAKAAVMRAAPFGPVGNLPRPWQFNETFLYNDALKFQLRSLVEGE